MVAPFGRAGKRSCGVAGSATRRRSLWWRLRHGLRLTSAPALAGPCRLPAPCLWRPLTFVALILVPALASAAQLAAAPDAVGVFVDRLRALAAAGDATGLREIGTPIPGGASLDDFISAMTPAPSQLVIKERDRTPLPEQRQRLLLEVFSARNAEARVGTWQMDVATAGGGLPGAERWRVTRMERLSSVTGLYRLGLDLSTQFDVRNLNVRAPDLTLDMSAGTAFIASTGDGPTAIVLLGRGRMEFAPQQASERTQVQIFAGDERLVTDFDALLIRLRPSDYQSIVATGALTPRPPTIGDAARAGRYFEDYVGRSLNLDLNDMSRDRWSLVPRQGDLIAEIRTKRFGNLTYTRVQSDAEDVSLFDRQRRKNISVYASRERMRDRGLFYSEDDGADYDVLSYNLEADFSPERLWIDGRAGLTLRILGSSATGITLKIADALAIRSVSSRELGRLMFLRVVGQNSVIVNFPVPLPGGTAVDLQVVYGGRIEPQALDREAIGVGQEQEPIVLQPEPRYVYSNRSYWYPQSMVGDYATARIAITVPAGYDAVASGTPSEPAAPLPARPGERPRKLFVFNAVQPLRYLACVISRFNLVSTTTILLPPGGGAVRGPAPPPVPQAGPAIQTPLSLVVEANPRQTSRGRSMADRTTAVLRFYASVMGEAPYPSLTLALSENDLPGGHSPAYVVLLNQTLPSSPFVWRNDPVSFDNYPSFFLAHELAHQWWGQAVGWKNYHEQWLSEGFAQYFAALYAEEERGPETFAGVMRQMRRWGIEASPQGPIYLGYRLGHIKSDSRVFRAVLYNKSAVVLHMLRRLVGDDAFFRGLRGFYSAARFRKAGTDDFQRSVEEASGQNLRTFFDAWIFGADIPRLRVTHMVQGTDVAVTIDQRAGVMPVPVTMTLVYAKGETERVVVTSDAPRVTRTIPLNGVLRELVVNEEQALAVFER